MCDLAKLQADMVTGDTQQVTRDTWRLTPDTWQISSKINIFTYNNNCQEISGYQVMHFMIDI